MGFRYMRLLLFFDLPSVTTLDKKIYRKYVKSLTSEGFYRLQESVFVKLSINQQYAESTITKVKSFSPKDGNVMILVITEKQFSSLRIITGESKTDVVNSVSRVITL